jgi:hypothetical protein
MLRLFGLRIQVLLWAISNLNIRYSQQEALARLQPTNKINRHIFGVGRVAVITKAQNVVFASTMDILWFV